MLHCRCVNLYTWCTTKLLNFRFANPGAVKASHRLLSGDCTKEQECSKQIYYHEEFYVLSRSRISSTSLRHRNELSMSTMVNVMVILSPRDGSSLVITQHSRAFLQHMMTSSNENSALPVLCAGNSPVTGESSPVNSPHKGQWRGVLMFSLICAWTKG